MHHVVAIGYVISLMRHQVMGVAILFLFEPYISPSKGIQVSLRASEGSYNTGVQHLVPISYNFKSEDLSQPIYVSMPQTSRAEGSESPALLYP